MIKTLKRTCPICGKDFDRKIYEINKVEKRGATPICSLACTRILGNKNKIKKPRSSKEIKSSKENIQKAIKANTKDPVQVGLNRLLNYARRRSKEFNLTYNDLFEIWDKQGGKCAYIGNQLILPNSKGSKADPRVLASVDRINSNLGYIKNNVQIVSVCINYMKAQLSHNETCDFIKIIKGN